MSLIKTIIFRESTISKSSFSVSTTSAESGLDLDLVKLEIGFGHALLTNVQFKIIKRQCCFASIILYSPDVITVKYTLTLKSLIVSS